MWVNEVLKQSGSTKDMERSVGELVAFLSNIFGLRAGDIIFTGTPEGVGQILSGDKLRARLGQFVELNVTAL
jgi:2-keto-4-pentenoate hydratase/2-oxohepta-3-ene-1,7-dioic acid hydratase in catechol pathway